MFILIVCVPVCDVINFEIYHTFLIKTFSYLNLKSHFKNVNITRTKKAFNMKYLTKANKTNSFGRWKPGFKAGEDFTHFNCCLLILIEGFTHHLLSENVHWKFYFQFQRKKEIRSTVWLMYGQFMVNVRLKDARIILIRNQDYVTRHIYFLVHLFK